MNVTDSNNFNRHLSSYKEGFHPDPQAGLARLHDRLGIIEPESPAVVRTMPVRRWYGIAATLVIVIVASFLLLRGDGSTTLYNQTAAPMAYLLPDGTEVTLQQGSELTYPKAYNWHERPVLLKGQAYFEVHKDADRPFLVNTAATQLRVTGTAFNLRVTEGELEVEVSEGSVELRHEGETVAVSAKQCGLATVGKKCALMNAENLNRHAWRTGTLRFDSVPLPAVLKTISNNYGYNLSYPADCEFPITGIFAANDPVAVLQTLAEMDGGHLEPMDKISFRFSNMTCGE